MVAEGWQKWWKTFEQDAQKINERLVELAEIKQGDKVLDIATGIGEPALTAARKVGIKGYVLATDISSQMLNIAKQRTASFGLTDIIEFKEIDAERIDTDLQPLGFLLLLLIIIPLPMLKFLVHLVLLILI